MNRFDVFKLFEQIRVPRVSGDEPDNVRWYLNGLFRVPRVSGDEPDVRNAVIEIHASSPRKRG